MNANKRRGAVLRLLQSSNVPLAGAQLSAKLGVTRQVIVQDIAVLRASGASILATPRGYTMLPKARARGVTKLIAVRHDSSQTKDELYCAVDLDVEVLDVIVDHPVYGQLTGQLSCQTREDVDEFLVTMEHTGAGLLSSLTDGVHLHTVRGKDKTVIQSLEQALTKMGILLTE